MVRNLTNKKRKEELKEARQSEVKGGMVPIPDIMEEYAWCVARCNKAGCDSTEGGDEISVAFGWNAGH